MRDYLRDRQQWGSKAVVSAPGGPATLAALDVLKEGGNAFDAAVTISSILTVTLPMASGPGGDASAILFDARAGRSTSLLALGCAPRRATIDAYLERGLSAIPEIGPLSFSTPGLVDGWIAVNARYGSLPMRRLLEPAIDLARNGTPATSQFVRWNAANLEYLLQDDMRALYGPYAEPDAVGSIIKQPGLAVLFETIAQHSAHPDVLRKLLGERIAQTAQAAGGLIEVEDITRDAAEFVDPVTFVVGGTEVSTTPAPTQGPLLAQTVGAYLRFAGKEDSLRTSSGLHLLAEVVNQVYGWRLKHLGDPQFTKVPHPLEESALATVGEGINRESRSDPLALGHYNQGGTSQFSLIDSDGNGVSWIQSLGLGFGSGIAVSDLGLFIGDRLGRSATLRPAEANSVAPWKRPVNTIHTWGASSNGRLLWMGGTPGGDGQVQWNAQTLISLLAEKTTPLEALTRPKVTYYPGVDKAETDMVPQLRVDDTLPDEDVEDLKRRGHKLVVTASIGGISRLVGQTETSLYGLDDGRHEGLTAAL